MTEVWICGGIYTVEPISGRQEFRAVGSQGGPPYVATTLDAGKLMYCYCAHHSALYVLELSSGLARRVVAGDPAAARLVQAANPATVVVPKAELDRVREAVRTSRFWQLPVDA